MSTRQPDEPGRQAGVLALLADGQRQLVVAHDHRRRSRLVVEPDLADPRRLQGGLDELDRVVGEGHDVDPLAAQLVGDHPHPRATRPDTGADGVDVGVVRPDGDLGPVPGLTGARP